MALGSTIRKVDLSVADIDRGYYADHLLTVAQHPSETEDRMMLRVLAFAMFADQALEFGRGLSTDDEPDLWQRSLSGEIERWIDLGMPDEKRIRKACGRAGQVVIITYGGSKADVWNQRQARLLQRFKNLTVFGIDDESVASLARMIARTMNLSASIQDAQILIASDKDSLTIAPRTLKAI